MAKRPAASWVGPPPERSTNTRLRPTLPSQASVKAVAAVAKVPPLHPPYDPGFGSTTAPITRTPTPALQGLPAVTAHYPLN